MLQTRRAVNIFAHEIIPNDENYNHIHITLVDIIVTILTEHECVFYLSRSDEVLNDLKEQLLPHTIIRR